MVGISESHRIDSRKKSNTENADDCTNPVNAKDTRGKNFLVKFKYSRDGPIKIQKAREVE